MAPQIPVYEQQTQQPFASPGARLNAPETTPVPVGQAVSKLGDQLNQIWQVQQQHQRTLDLTDRALQFSKQAFNIKTQIQKTEPGAMWAQSYEQQTKDLQAKILADPANAHIKEELGVALAKKAEQDRQDMTIHGLTATEKEQGFQADNIANQAISTIATDIHQVPAALARNAQFAKPGQYNTALPPTQEAQFRDWLTKNNVPFDPSASGPQDYDMRGYYKDVASKGGNETGVNPVDKKLHFPDTYKTPYHESFSAESKFATESNPFKWRGETLIDERTGTPVYQTGRKGSSPTAFVEGANAQAARQQVYAIYEAQYAGKPEEIAAHKLKFEHKIAIESGVAIARDHPHDVEQYINQMGDKLTPSEGAGLVGKAIEAVGLGQRQMNADRGATRVQYNQKLDQMIASRNPAAEETAQNWVNLGVIEREDFQRRYGHPPKEQDVPGMYDYFAQAIKDNPENWDQAVISAQMGIGRESKARLGLLLTQTRQSRKNPLEIYKAKVNNDLLDAIRTSGDFNTDEVLDAYDSTFKKTLADKARNLKEALIDKAPDEVSVNKGRDEVLKYVTEQRRAKLDAFIKKYPDAAKKYHLAPAIPADPLAAAAEQAKREGWTGK